MNSFWGKSFFSFVLVLSLFVAGCGGGGSTGTANTVAVTASITNNTAAYVFAHFSSNAQFVTNNMNVTLTSAALNSTGSIPVSPVLIKSIKVGLSSLPYSSYPLNSSNVLSPTIARPQYASNNSAGGVIPGPGKLDIPVNLFGDIDAQAVLGSINIDRFDSILFNYQANVTFNLEESNTGHDFSVSIPLSVEFRAK